jgi:hypothetical protein
MVTNDNPSTEINQTIRRSRRLQQREQQRENSTARFPLGGIFRVVRNFSVSCDFSDGTN